MKIAGLITEYNPFHNGHKYHIEETKRITGADYIVVIMSGNFVQRGTPALIDKYTRTQMALDGGANLVIELPVCYAAASAEYFAMGAVSILEQLHIVDYICFGSESGDIKNLSKIAHMLAEESQSFKSALQTNLKTGMTYPAARSKALVSCLDPSQDTGHNSISCILESPNNILGIEYLKALIKLKSPIVPYTITRSTTGYHDRTLLEEISSATAIRLAISEGRPLTDVIPHMPPKAFRLLEKFYLKTFPIFEEDYSLLLQYKLLSTDLETLTDYLDITKDLAKRFLNLPIAGYSFSELAEQLKSKQYTLTRINRALLHVLLNITTREMLSFNKNGCSQYARILGIDRAAGSFIKQVKKNSSIPVINKTTAGLKSLSPLGQIMLKQDIYAAHLYNTVVYSKYKTAIKNEFTHGIIIK